MTRNDLASIGVWAFAAFGITLAVLLPSRLQAVDDNQALPVTHPILNVQGCEVSVSLKSTETLGIRPLLRPGDSPELELKATNPTDHPAEFSCTTRLFGIDKPVSPMSRSMPMPTEIWSSQSHIILSPGQSKTLKLATNTPLKDGHGYVLIEAEKQKISAVNFIVAESLKTLEHPTTLPAAVSQSE